MGSFSDVCRRQDLQMLDQMLDRLFAARGAGEDDRRPLADRIERLLGTPLMKQCPAEIALGLRELVRRRRKDFLTYFERFEQQLLGNRIRDC
ncbi:MAG: hypothetical protein JSS54_17530 [Proteobacteria bacterium]|nr:hypothetical protein [Pseudomonadota bacterium]